MRFLRQGLTGEQRISVRLDYQWHPWTVRDPGIINGRYKTINVTGAPDLGLNTFQISLIWWMEDQQ